MFGDSVVNFQFSAINFTSLAQNLAFHLFFEKVGRFHVSNIVCLIETIHFRIYLLQLATSYFQIKT